MHRYGTGILLLAGLLAAGPARGAPDPPSLKIVYVAPLTGPLQNRSEEYLEGMRAAAEAWSGSDVLEGRALEIVPLDTRDDPKTDKQIKKTLKKLKPVAIVNAPGRCCKSSLKMLRERKRPLLLITPWERFYSLDPKDPLLHLSTGAVDQAIAAVQRSMLPLRALKAAALHDGSEPSKALARAYLRNLPERIVSGGEIFCDRHADVTAATLKKLREEKVDLCYVATEADVALVVAEQAKQGGGPRLLFHEGLLTQELFKAAPPEALFIEGAFPYFEGGAALRYRKQRKKQGLPPAPVAERGYSAVSLIVNGIEAAAKERGVSLLEALKKFGDKARMGTPLFTEWGQMKLFEYFVYHVKDGKPERYNPLYLPSTAGGLLLRLRPAARYKLELGSRMIHMTWGNEKVRTIESDLKRLNLTSDTYFPDMDEWVKDGLMSRAMARLNRIFWRNADGTPIPGVSFNITFGMEIPKGAKGHKVWRVTVAGDDPVAGGRAFGNRASTYSTFLVRTMYEKHKLPKRLEYQDYQFFNYKYKWGEKLELNLRHDNVRSLIDGFSSGIAMTTAHETGHLGGCGHDTASPRSIMNVLEGGGLDDTYAEWVPKHVEYLERSLGRVPYPGREGKHGS
ncbi:MAG: ABC transporter substrate-binding protein [Planctomycetota bacterium]|nr:ABC transporter substrate-binding protein [Planctomycetota bacterium]